MLGNTAALQSFLEDRRTLQGPFNGGVITHRLDGTAIAEVSLSSGRIGVNFMGFDTKVAALEDLY